MIALMLARTVRFGLLAAGFLAPVAVGVIVRAAGQSAVVVATLQGEPEPTACDATRFYTACAAGERCAAGRCLAVGEAVRAGDGEDCVGVVCEPGLECHGERCVSVERLNVAPASCRQPAVEAALEALKRSCAQARGEREPLLTHCRADEWRQVSQGATSFEEHVMAMPGAFSVFFPANAPDEAGKWPNIVVRQHYAEGLQDHARDLGTARLILVIGRASASGGDDANRRLAERRAEMVDRLIDELLGVGHAPSARWGLAHDFPMSMEAVRRRLGASLPIAADVPAVAALRDLQSPEFDLEALPPKEWSRLGRTLNQVTFVVPLPCDGSEYKPSPSLQLRGPGQTGPKSERLP